VVHRSLTSLKPACKITAGTPAIAFFRSDVCPKSVAASAPVAENRRSSLFGSPAGKLDGSAKSPIAFFRSDVCPKSVAASAPVAENRRSSLFGSPAGKLKTVPQKARFARLELELFSKPSGFGLFTGSSNLMAT
jgi:hypothetical protein